MSPAQRFAIQRDDLGFQSLGDAPCPRAEAAFELLGVEGGEHAPERVMRGNPVRQVQEGGEPGAPRGAEFGDLDPRIGAAEHGAQGNRQDRLQAVPYSQRRAWVTQVCKPRNNTAFFYLGHCSPPRNDRSISTLSFSSSRTRLPWSGPWMSCWSRAWRCLWSTVQAVRPAWIGRRRPRRPPRATPGSARPSPVGTRSL